MAAAQVAGAAGFYLAEGDRSHRSVPYEILSFPGVPDEFSNTLPVWRNGRELATHAHCFISGHLE